MGIFIDAYDWILILILIHGCEKYPARSLPVSDDSISNLTVWILLILFTQTKAKPSPLDAWIVHILTLIMA